MTRATLRTSFKVKRSKVRVTGRLTQTHKMRHTFRTVRPIEELQSWCADADGGQSAEDDGGRISGKRYDLQC